MNEKRLEACDFVRYYVWSGHYDTDEIFDIIDDEVFFDCDDEKEEWLKKVINHEFCEKRKAERTWPPVTSCDQLDQIFQTLRRHGVLSQHRCGMTIQDGLDVIELIYEDEGGH